MWWYTNANPAVTSLYTWSSTSAVYEPFAKFKLSNILVSLLLRKHLTELRCVFLLVGFSLLIIKTSVVVSGVATSFIEVTLTATTTPSATQSTSAMDVTPSTSNSVTTVALTAQGKIGAIVGGTLGGIIGIAFLFGVLYYYYRRGHRGGQLRSNGARTLAAHESAATVCGNLEPKPNGLEERADNEKKLQHPTSSALRYFNEERLGAARMQ